MNIIVPIVENVEGFCKFIKENSSNDRIFVVGIRKNLLDKFKLKSKNVDLHVFDDKSKKEEIINALHSYCIQYTKLAVVRRPLLKDEFEKLVNSNYDISVVQRKRSKASRGFKNFVSGLIKRLFAFTYFDDISAICYNENMFDLISVCPNLSMATRINRYVGVDIDEIETEIEPVKKEYNKKKNILALCSGIGIFLASVAGIVLLSIFVKFNFLMLIIDLFMAIIGLSFLAFSALTFARTIAVGDLRFEKATEIAVEKKEPAEKKKTAKKASTKTTNKTATKKVTSTKKQQRKQQNKK